MGPYLSPIKYGTTHDNYLKTIKIKLNKQNEWKYSLSVIDSLPTKLMSKQNQNLFQLLSAKFFKTI